MRLLLFVLLSVPLCAAEYASPAGERHAAPRPGAVSVLPGGRLLEPHGRQFATGPGSFGIAINRKGDRIVTANGGPESFSVTLLERDDRRRFRVETISTPALGSKEYAEDPWESVFMGVAFADDDEVFVSEGESGRVRRIKVDSRGRPVQQYALNTGGYEDSYSGDLAYDPARTLLCVLDQANSRVVLIDARRQRQLATLRVGRLPFAMDLSPDGKRLYITHVGMFEYQALPDAEVSQSRRTGLAFPAFGFPSEEARSGASRETGGGVVEVAGLGDPNTEEANSVWAVNIEDPLQPTVVKKIRTGKPVGPDSHGGSSPSGVLATAERIYVANANQDSVTVIDAGSLEIVDEIALRIPGLDSLRGVMPAGMDYHPASGWLMVAEAGINAVAVIDTRLDQVIGHIPTAWYPVDVAIHGDDVYVVSALGHGIGATANKMIAIREPESRAPGGAVTVFPLPAERELKLLTRQVTETNGFVPRREAEAPEYPEEIRHVVLIVKESRSYDEILGDVGRVGTHEANGAPMLARFGRFGTARAAGGGFSTRFSLKNVNVTPNHHALAVRWAFSDNFHSDAATSVGGHHWLAGVPPNPWTVSSLMASYGGQKEFRLDSQAPGRRAFAETRASVHPEAIPENGALWHHLEQHGVSFRNFGEGFELAGTQMGPGMGPAGVRLLTNVPMPEPLYRNTSREYPGYNTNIPDQQRADRFIQEIHNTYVARGKDLPRFLYIHLPNDDTSLARPSDGYNFSASFVADNDYALGRIVEFLSTTPYWRNMVIFVTEDEAHGGVDHVNARRVPLLAAGPWVKQGYVSHRNTSFPGLQKTIYGLLGIPPLHLLDAAATDLSDLFTGEPDFTLYEVQSVPEELFVPERAKPAEQLY